MTIAYETLLSHWLTLHGLFVMLGLSIYVATSHTLHLRRHPSASIAWVVALVLLPYITLPLYLMFGIRKVKSARSFVRVSESATQDSGSDTLASRTQRLAAVMALPVASPYHQLNIHEDGSQSLQVLRSMIDSAMHTIELSTFVFASDELGNELASRLMRRAREGIKVRADGGRYRGVSRWTDRLQKPVRCGSPGGFFRAAFALVAAGTYQSSESSQDGCRGRRMVVVRWQKSCCRVFRRRRKSSQTPHPGSI